MSRTFRPLVERLVSSDPRTLTPPDTLDAAILPTTSAPVPITTSEALADGDFVNIWNSSGAKARKANATVVGKEADGYVLAAVGSGASASVYRSGVNDHLTGLTPGMAFLSTTAGAPTSTAPSGTGNVVQRIGTVLSPSSIEFRPQHIGVLA